MKFMTLVKSTEGRRVGPPPPALVQGMAKLAEDAGKAGIAVQRGGLCDSSAGAMLRLSGGKLTVTDGPFSEAKEVVGGFAIYDVPSKADAVAWASRVLELHRQYWPQWEGSCEVRQIMDGPPG